MATSDGSQQSAAEFTTPILPTPGTPTGFAATPAGAVAGTPEGNSAVHHEITGLPPRVSEEIVRLRSAGREYDAVYLMATEFRPCAGTQFAWVLVLAKEQYATALKTFDDIDAKAGTVIGYFGGGAGALAVGSLAAMAADRLPVQALWAAVPSFIAAAAAVVAATIARYGRGFFSPPLTGAARFATDLPDTGEIAFAGQWAIAAEKTYAVNESKARWYNRATVAAAGAIGCLVLPLLTALVVGPVRTLPLPPAVVVVQAVAPAAVAAP